MSDGNNNSTNLSDNPTAPLTLEQFLERLGQALYSQSQTTLDLIAKQAKTHEESQKDQSEKWEKLLITLKQASTDRPAIKARVPEPSKLKFKRRSLENEKLKELVDKFVAYFEICETPADKFAKIFPSYMEGDVASWFSNYSEKNPVFTLKQFQNAIYDEFKTDAFSSTAWVKFSDLTMKYTFQDNQVNAFTSRVTTLAAQAKAEDSTVTEVELMRMLRKATPQFEEAWSTKKKTSEWESVVNMCSEIHKWHVTLKTRHNTGIRVMPATSANPTNSQNEPTPMELDKLSIPSKKALERKGVNTDLKERKTGRTLNDEEKMKYRLEGRCFKCHEIAGHIARECPKSNPAPFRRD